MKVTKSVFCDINSSDIISILGEEKRNILVSWLKTHSYYGQKQPQGGGDFYFELEQFVELDETENIFNENHCPDNIFKIINDLKREQIKTINQMIPLRFEMIAWN